MSDRQNYMRVIFTVGGAWAVAAALMVVLDISLLLSLISSPVESQWSLTLVMIGDAALAYYCLRRADRLAKIKLREGTRQR